MDSLELATHIICVIIIVVFCLSGSSFTIYFYSKKKPVNVGRIFIIALALLDIFASVVVAPQIPFADYYIELFERGKVVPIDLFFLVLPFLIMSYLFILTSIAVDRAVAVLKPYSYTQSQKRTVMIVITDMLISLVLSLQIKVVRQVFGEKGQFGRSMISVFIVLSFLAILISYSLIIYKLKKQNRIIKPKNQGNIVIEASGSRKTGETSKGTTQTIATPQS